MSVCLLESGGLAFEEETQRLARAADGGDPVLPPARDAHPRPRRVDLVVRRRLYAASTRSRFEARPWVPNGRWPFARVDAGPIPRRAPWSCSASAASTREAVDAATSADVRRGRLRRGAGRAGARLLRAPGRFGPAYRERCQRRRRLRVCLHTTATGLQVEAGRVVGVGASPRPPEPRGARARRRPGRRRHRERPAAAHRGPWWRCRRTLLHGASARRRPLPHPVRGHAARRGSSAAARPGRCASCA